MLTQSTPTAPIHLALVLWKRLGQQWVFLHGGARHVHQTTSWLMVLPGCITSKENARAMIRRTTRVMPWQTGIISGEAPGAPGALHPLRAQGGLQLLIMAGRRAVAESVGGADVDAGGRGAALPDQRAEGGLLRTAQERAPGLGGVAVDRAEPAVGAAAAVVRDASGAPEGGGFQGDSAPRTERNTQKQIAR
jgi:hypothetical protein